MKPELHEWLGCYDGSWTGIITPESFAHPAKFARGLIERIFDYCLEKGYLKRGDRVGDCFGGIGTGGIVAAYRGLHWYAVELEPRFCRMAEANFALHRHGWSQTGKGTATIIQGDSRRFCETVIPASLVMGNPITGIVSSPPFLDARSDTEKSRPTKHGGPCEERHHTSQAGNGYGESNGQIGSLKSGQVDSVISSPPFTQGYQGGGGINKNGYGKDGADKVGSRTYQGQGGDRTQGNIETLKEGTVDACISSPPYAETSPEKSGSGVNIEKQWQTYRAQGGGMNLEKFTAQQARHSEGYGTTTGQISQLKSGSVDGVVSSPPFMDNGLGSNCGVARNRQVVKNSYAVPNEKPRDITYGATEGQIGKESGETYWQAVDAVYRNCFQVIKPGGVIVLVVKDYCARGKRVRLCDDTMRLLEHIGFQPLERIHAMLVTETKHNDLFDGETTTKKQRKSFFRRLYEAKLPEDDERRIDYEEVLIAQRP